METDIAPLAKRLAEENNVDWHKLEGTGENGRIVERDVLDYLARVMAGEAAVDPTPEPLPEGMEAWVDDDGNPIAPPESESDADEEPSRTATSVDGDEDLLLAGDDLASDDQVSSDVERPRDDGPTDATSTPSAAAADGQREDARARAAQEHAAQEHDSQEHDAPDLFAADEEDGTGSRGAPDLFEADGGQSESKPNDDRPSDAFDFGGLPGAHRAGVEATDDEAAAISFDLGADEDESDARRDGDDAADGFEVDTADAPSSSDADVDHDAESRDEPAYEPATEPVAEPVDTPARASSDVRQPEAASAANDAGARSPGGPGTPSELPLARVKTVVRRHVDLGRMLELQRSVGLETGRGHVPAAAVLLLAARRSGGRIDVEAPGVAVVGGASNVRVVVPAASSLGDVADEIDEVQRGASAANDDADLWVADLSGLRIDEAILDTDLPQLTLGRVMSDDEDGSLHGTLTLASDHDLDHAAAFLTRVADLIEDPLRLLA